MTPEEQAEWNYIRAERLGISCEDRAPTAAEIKRAEQAADDAVKGPQTMELFTP